LYNLAFLSAWKYSAACTDKVVAETIKMASRATRIGFLFMIYPEESGRVP
jgi:hypothetical protein